MPIVTRWSALLLLPHPVVRGFSWKNPIQTFATTTRVRFASSLSSSMFVSVPDAIRRLEEDNGEIRFVDGSWFMPSTGRNGREEFEKGPRIPGAAYFDIDTIASKSPEDNPKGLPHMMPPPPIFGAAMDAMDITNDSNIIVYSTKDCIWLHRTWFQLKAMGHDKVELLEGSFEDWKEAGGPVEDGFKKSVDVDALPSTPPAYQATAPRQVASMQDVVNVVAGEDKKDAVLLDARAADRFSGAVAEPRPGLRRGHMPGAINLPHTILLDSDNVSVLKSKEEIKELLVAAGVDPDDERDIITTCGSGVTACTLALALEYVGRDPSKTFVYDGSWIEWGPEDAETPVETTSD